jgi:selenocysteine lyase/cysteine desulfurase
VDLAAIRAEIPALATTTYLNAAGIGPSPRVVADTIVRLYRQIEVESPDSMAFAREEFTGAEATRARVASHWRVDADEVALLRSTAEGFNLVGHGLRWRAGDEIVSAIQDHPAARSIWTVLARRYDLVVRHVDVRPDLDRAGVLAAVEAAMSPRTRLVSISHVMAENGALVPAAELCALAHAQGAAVFLDGTQAVGQAPFDLRAIGVDYYAAGFYKWALGPFGTGALYVRADRLAEVDQVLVGAGGHSEFAHATAEWVPYQSARKFEFGARHWPLYPAMAAGLGFIEEVGLEAIRARSAALVDRLRAELRGVPGTIDFTPDDPALRTGIVAAAVEGMAGADLRDRLRAQGFLLRANRGPDGITGVRICCAFFNSEEEIERVAAALRTIAAERAGVGAVR